MYLPEEPQMTAMPQPSHMNEVPTWLDSDDDDFEYTFPLGPRPRPGALNRRLVRALLPCLRQIPTEEAVASKPLELHLHLPLPPRLRFYIFLATQHESERQVDTYRVQLTAGDAAAPKKFRFSRASSIRPVLMGYVAALDLFIIWDADVIDAGGGFSYSQGVQAPPDLVYRALAEGVADGTRHVRRAGTRESIVVVRRSRLVDGLLRRIELSNGALGRATTPC